MKTTKLPKIRCYNWTDELRKVADRKKSEIEFHLLAFHALEALGMDTRQEKRVQKPRTVRKIGNLLMFPASS